MDSISLVKNALEYYDQNNGIVNELLKNAQFVKLIKAENDMDNNVIVFFDENKNEIFKSRYEIIGVYATDSNIWVWSWAIPIFKKNSTNIARKIWHYGAMLDPSAEFLKTELITSRFKISNEIQLDIHVGIASYISKNKLIYKHFNYANITPDTDGYLHIGEVQNDDHTIYYMFLLDNIN